VEIMRISVITEGNAWSPKDLKSGCQYINTGYSYQFEIEEERRLHSIHIRTTISYWNHLKKAALTFQGRKKDRSERENLKVTRTNHELNFSSSFVLTDFSKSYHFKYFSFASNAWVYICEIVLFAYHDECGHPEVPLNGRVQWKPDDTEAIYRCEDGYQLDSNYSTRHCIQGQWNGSQPICIRLNNFFDAPVSGESVTTEATSRK
jgi:Sushi repeat (SCR repeat)